MKLWQIMYVRKHITKKTLQFLLVVMLFFIANNICGQTVSINWNVPLKTISKNHWSYNEYEIVRVGNDAGLCSYMQNLKTGIVRIHWGDLVDTWTDPVTRDWKIPEMTAAFANFSSCLNGSKVMLNINAWPKWLQTSTTTPLDASKQTEFIDLCGRLAFIMKNTINFKIDYYEFLNEKEEVYGGNYGTAPNASLYNLCNAISLKIKSIDAAALTGGPSSSYCSPTWRDAWAVACGANADFYSYHAYRQGPPPSSNLGELLLTGPFAVNDYLTGEALYIKTLLPGIKVFQTEMNVQYDYTPFEIRHRNNEGAVWQAINVRHHVKKGLDGVMVWHAKGDAYGLLKSDNSKNATGTLYEWGNKFLVGTMPANTTTDTTKFEIIPVMQADNTASILLLSKVSTPIINVNAILLIPTGHSITSITQIDTLNWTGRNIAISNGANLTLEKFSLTLIRTAPTSSLAAINFILDVEKIAENKLKFTCESNLSNVQNYTLQKQNNVGGFDDVVTTGNNNTTVFSTTINFEEGIYRMKSMGITGVNNFSNIVFVTLRNTNKIAVFPNPCSDKIVIYQNNLAPSDIVVFDCIGKKMNLPFDISSNNVALNTSTLSDGVYYVRIYLSATKKYETIKFIKKN